jgi:hypothetical protein
MDVQSRIIELEAELRKLRRPYSGAIQQKPLSLMTTEEHRLCGCGATAHEDFLRSGSPPLPSS